MNNRAVASASLTSLGLVVMGLHQFAGLSASAVSAGSTSSSAAATASATAAASSTATSTATTSAATSSSATSSVATSSASSATSSASASGWKDGTYTGTTETYQYGTLSVTVTVSGGKITAVTENLVEDGSGRTQQIDSYAVPELRQEVLSANSSDISMISGATFTSQAYQASLQSALDQA